MQLLEDRINKDGIVKEGNVLKVDSFLNHQMDIELYNEIGKEFRRLFPDKSINKILTIEASGIAIACMAARYFNVPVVFAKKAKSKNIDGEVFTSKVQSFTYGREYDITLAKKFLSPSDRVLILDDFLANGKAMKGLLDVLFNVTAAAERIVCHIQRCSAVHGKKHQHAQHRPQGKQHRCAPLLLLQTNQSGAPFPL